MSITDFLNDRLYDDTKRALAASRHHWEASQWSNDAHREFLVVADETSGAPAFGIKNQADAAHIVAHDPARVLREVAAKRRILGFHSIDPAKIVTYNKLDANHRWIGHTYPCQGCGIDGMGVDYLVTDIEECPELQALASVYADHPDYQKEWADDTV